MKRVICGTGLVALYAMISPMPALGQQGQPGMDEVMKAMSSFLGASTNASVAVVDFRDLKALLPATVAGMKRLSASGEKSGAMGMTVSLAEAEYEDGQGGSVSLKISDMGGTGGLMAMAHFGWAATEIDRETDTGYERTTTINGNKAYQKYDTAEKRGEVNIMVAERFLVEVQGYGVPEDILKKTVDLVDLNKLASLKPVTP